MSHNNKIATLIRRLEIIKMFLLFGISLLAALGGIIFSAYSMPISAGIFYILAFLGIIYVKLDDIFHLMRQKPSKPTRRKGTK